MPAKKGFTNNPNGRKKGVPNRVTSDIKEAYRLLVESNLSNMQGWLNEIAAKDPARAINILIELTEYVVPKLARTELTGNIVEHPKTTINFTKPNNNITLTEDQINKLIDKI